MSTNTQVHRALLEAATKMKKIAPQDWGYFLQALSASAEIDNENLLSAEPSSILHAQGRAVAMQQLCLNLASAESQLEKLAHQEKRAGKPRDQQWP
ncbi:hypothetical protein [Methylobacterium sp. GXF4]|uniref:hypothetical protein n=1 Tax=Methylobacterium sp. GXF4 TaxID=1096546 RepID=UPI000FFE5696|nr:hypothetical protein [Methylobacterium sp. GXF4]